MNNEFNTKQPPRMKTCPTAHDGCGEILEVCEDNFYIHRSLLDTGRTCVTWSKRCKKCEGKYKREKKRAERERIEAEKQKRLEQRKICDNFLYPGRAF